MPTREAAEARREAAELAARLSVEAHRTERVRVILAALLFPTLALITVWLISLGVGVTEWLTVVVAPVLTVVIGFVLSGRVAAVAKATSEAVAATGEVIDANRLHASAAAARAEAHSEPKTDAGPPPDPGGGPAPSPAGGRSSDT